MLKNREVDKTANILDISAGIGLFSEMIRDKGYKVSCMEPDLYQANILKEKGFDVETDLDKVPDESCDLIYALNVLEHIEDDYDIMEQWAKKRKKGGRMFIYVPAFNVLFSSMDRKVGHFRRYKRKNLTSVLEKANLNPIRKAKYADSLGFMVSYLYKLINRKDGDINKGSLIFYDRILFPLSKFGDFFFNKLFGKNVYIIAEKK